MAQTNSYPTLSDGLSALMRAFEPCRKTGVVMVKKDVGTFLDGLQAMYDEARHLETIAERAQWNAKAKREQLEAAVADGSVSILPVVARPTARNGGGGQEGGAA